MRKKKLFRRAITQYRNKNKKINFLCDCHCHGYAAFSKQIRGKIDLDPKIDGNKFDYQKEVKFLGVKFDSGLNFRSMFKIDSVNAEWCNIQSYINCKSLLMMCKNSAVRYILKLKCDTPSNILYHEAFDKLKLLTVSNRLFSAKKIKDKNKFQIIKKKSMN
ncbi:hypothetical protein BpHYR1_053296 [Brachionus plicatilis]|uniref:RNA-directed DNA polymerase from mobile element jockey-like n=1 Tax=Brachionus plicatilis TaxID=10195 RepID=A0A3M7Q6Z7_BRAPC|nr:hypothetical protein BpHYR1_053296 [Brachionus plicatilis]